MLKKFTFSFALIAIFFTLNASAQNPTDGGAGGSVPGESAIDPGGSATSTSSGQASSPQAGSVGGSVATSSAAQAIPAADNQARATSSAPLPPPFDPAQGKPKPTPPPPTPSPTEHSNILENVGMSSGTAETTDDDTTGTVLAVVASVLGAGALGAGAYAMLRGKKTKSDDGEGRCFDIKKLMEEKLKELTDLRGQLENKAKETAREAVKGAAAGTAAGNALAAIEKAEKEYARLKQLYEKCITDLPKKKRVIIVHGCSSAPEEMDPATRTYDKHWIPWIKKELITQGIKTETPSMPEPWAPKYETFKQEFDKLDIAEDSILIGHSCGCAFLVRWLGDTKKKVDKLILVAPWKIAGENSPKKSFYEYPIDEAIKSRVGQIVMFTADNEEFNGKESLRIFHQALGGEIIDLKGRGHYTQDDMGTNEFPELLEVVLK